MKWNACRIPRSLLLCAAATSLVLATAVQAGVVVVQNVSPGATAWPGSPIVSTMANPASTATVAQSFNSGAGNTNISQTFTITTTNYTLQQIDIYAGTGTGTGTGTNLFLRLLDLGFQTAPEPAPYGGVTPNETIGKDLFNSGSGLSISYSVQPNGVLEFDFSGSDQVLLQVGHMYAFELTGISKQTPVNWMSRTSGSTYSGGCAYTNKYWLNASSGCEFPMAVYATALTSAPPGPATQTATVTADWNDVHQKIDGFGASSAWRGSWTVAQGDMLFSTNSGIGLSLLRSRIRPSDGLTDESSIMQMARDRGARVWSTPWTPPTQYKDSGSLNGGNYRGGAPTNQAYASYLANYVQKMTSLYGVNVFAISVQNEPDVNTTGYESCAWTGTQIHDFVPVFAATLAASNLSTKIIIPESQHWSSNPGLYTPTMGDATVATNISIMADHNYDGINADNTASSSPSALNASYPGTSLWETEVSALKGSYSSIYNGVYWAGRIHSFMTVAQANAWHHWWLITGNSTANQGLLDVAGNPTKRMYVMGNFSRFVRPNYNRIGVTLTQGIAQVSAYKDPTTGMFAIVAINPNPTNFISLTVNLSHFTNVCSVVPWVTSSSLSLASQAPVAIANSTLNYSLPGPSVVTFVGQSLPDSAPTDVALSNNQIPENQPAGASIGALTTTDPDCGDSFTYSLVDGPGSTDNSSFTISGNTLLTAATFDYQAHNSYSIRIRTTDSGGLFTEKVFPISVLAVPTDISLSSSSIQEQQPLGTPVGAFTTTDPNPGDTFTYSLVGGAGSTDNSSFTISGNTLQSAALFNFEVQSSYNIRVRSTTANNLWIEKSFNILVTDVNVIPNAPTNLSPVDNALNQPLTLSLQASAFNDPNLGDSQAASQWLIQRLSDNTVVFDSGIDSADTTSLAVGPGLLDYFTAYSWQMRYQDNHGEWSPYSTATSFSTQPPALSVLRQGTNVLISWPTNNAGFALQYSADLSPNSWNAVTDEPALVINQNVVTNQITNSATFFRLYKQ